MPIPPALLADRDLVPARGQIADLHASGHAPADRVIDAAPDRTDQCRIGSANATSDPGLLAIIELGESDTKPRQRIGRQAGLTDGESKAELRNQVEDPVFADRATARLQIRLEDFAGKLDPEVAPDIDADREAVTLLNRRRSDTGRRLRVQQHGDANPRDDVPGWPAVIGCGSNPRCTVQQSEGERERQSPDS